MKYASLQYKTENFNKESYARLYTYMTKEIEEVKRENKKNWIISDLVGANKGKVQ